MSLDFATFVRKPFTVEAVEVTADNIAEIAEYVGELKHKDDGTPYIEVDKKKVPHIFTVYIGFYMTRVPSDPEKIHCYSKKVFHRQFVHADEPTMQWLEFLNSENA